jgi:hypothetical protein
MLMMLLFFCCYSILNHVRGAGLLSKIICYALFGVLFSAVDPVRGTIAVAQPLLLLVLVSFLAGWILLFVALNKQGQPIAKTLQAIGYGLTILGVALLAMMEASSGSATFFLITFLIGFGGAYWGYAHCWGKYFPQPLDTSAQVCVQVVDNITTKVYMPYTSTTPIPQALNWKTIGMSFRWMIFFAPKYIVSAIYQYSGAGTFIMHGVLPILMLALVGIIYRVCFDVCASKPQWNKYNVASSEIVSGFWVGIIDGLVS